MAVVLSPKSIDRRWSEAGDLLPLIGVLFSSVISRSLVEGLPQNAWHVVAVDVGRAPSAARVTEAIDELAGLGVRQFINLTDQAHRGRPCARLAPALAAGVKSYGLDIACHDLEWQEEVKINSCCVASLGPDAFDWMATKSSALPELVLTTLLSVSPLASCDCQAGHGDGI